MNTGKVLRYGRQVLYVLMVSILYIYVIQDAMLDTAASNVVFFDVGQGDATYIKMGSVDIIVDGGQDSAFLHQLNRYMKVGERIEFLVITHFHQDHYQGLVEILKRYDIDTIVLPTSCINDEVVAYSISISSHNQIVYTDYIRFTIDREGMFNFYSNAEVDLCYKSQVDVNNSSVVAYFEWEEINILLMGDSEIERERRFLKQGILATDVDILKAGHHCSDSSSSYEFIKFTSPDLVICSFGEDNSYGHPGKRVIGMLKKMGIKYLYTADTGSIVINLE